MSLSLLAAAREAPRATALVLDGEAHTWESLALEVARAARWLERGAAESRGARGAIADSVPVAGNSPIALDAARTREALVLLHAAIALGRPVLPLHPLWPDVERRRLCALAGAITVDAGARPWRDTPPLPLDSTALTSVVDDARPLALVATSGTSGRARLVELSRAAFLASARASATNLGWREDDRWWLALPWAHIGGLSVLTRCLVARRPVVVDALERFEPLAAVERMRRDRVTLASLVPTQLGRIVEARLAPPPSLRALLVGGAAASTTLIDGARALGWPALLTYGLTEACSQVATQRPGDTGAGLPLLDGMEARVDEDGRLALRGATLCTRILDEDSATEVQGWLRTGDLGRRDADGRLHLLGRADDVIVTGGEKVAPAVVEEALRAFAPIVDACVFAVEDAAWGQRVAAALVLRAGAILDEQRLGAHLADRLPAFARPRLIAVLPSLPTPANGKIARRAVAELCAPSLRSL